MTGLLHSWLFIHSTFSTFLHRDGCVHIIHVNVSHNQQNTDSNLHKAHRQQARHGTAQRWTTQQEETTALSRRAARAEVEIGGCTQQSALGKQWMRQLISTEIRAIQTKNVSMHEGAHTLLLLNTTSLITRCQHTSELSHVWAQWVNQNMAAARAARPATAPTTGNLTGDLRHCMLCAWWSENWVECNCWCFIVVLAY